jgi:hypothetical protein
MIKTTINLNKKTLKTLEKASKKLNISETDIIKLLMQRIHEDTKKYLQFFSIVKYQKRDPENIWSCMHITLTPSEYENFIDMRKFFKKSVSNIIAFAVLKYLKSIIKKHSNIKLEDNNYTFCFPIYVFQVGMYKGVESFIISGKLPKNKHKNKKADIFFQYIQ